MASTQPLQSGRHRLSGKLQPSSSFQGSAVFSQASVPATVPSPQICDEQDRQLTQWGVAALQPASWPEGLVSSHISPHRVSMLRSPQTGAGR